MGDSEQGQIQIEQESRDFVLRDSPGCREDQPAGIGGRDEVRLTGVTVLGCIWPVVCQGDQAVCGAGILEIDGDNFLTCALDVLF